LMLIGAYRDNEVNPTHPLMRKLEAIPKLVRSQRISYLRPLAITLRDYSLDTNTAI